MRGGSEIVNPLIDEAAKKEENLDLDPLPRLIIFSSENGKGVRTDASWSRHSAKITNDGIAMILENRAEDIVLPGAADVNLIGEPA